MTRRISTRVAAVDPGFTYARRGARTVCAAVLSGLTLTAVTSVFDVSEPLPIALFGAGTCFFGALMVTDPRRGERVRTFGGAAGIAALAVVVTVELSRTAVWAAAAFLALQMFLSYAVRSRSLRAGDIAVIGSLVTFLTGAMHIASDRIGWFVLASTVGFAWIAASEFLILPDDPLRSLTRSVAVFCTNVGGVVGCAVDLVVRGCDPGTASPAAGDLRRYLDGVKRCRAAIETQLCGAVSPSPGFGHHGVEQLRVALYCAERGTQELATHADNPAWVGTLPDHISASMWSCLQDLAHALRGDSDSHSLDEVAGETQHLLDEMTPSVSNNVAQGCVHQGGVRVGPDQRYRRVVAE